MAAAARPLVQVYTGDSNVVTQVPLPGVLLAPIRPDIVRHVHTNIAKNDRQPYAVAREAGEQTSAASWGTGRAVARVPRVPGGGTHRSGQAAFGNNCRGGRMFGATKIWRKWHRKVNVSQRRFAICSALAASAVPALVMARGHKIGAVPEIPLVVATGQMAALTKTKDAVELLHKLGAKGDLARCSKRKLRAGRGKMRNRRYVRKLGPLVIFNEKNNEKATLTRAFRNIPGVDLVCVTRLNLLKLAPGGHVGRFVVWSQDAFERLDHLYGTVTQAATEKKDYHVPRNIMTTTDLSRIINSVEVQSALRAKKSKARGTPRKKNPLTNLGFRAKLDPHTIARRREAILSHTKSPAKIAGIKKAKKAKRIALKKTKSTKFIKRMLAP